MITKETMMKSEDARVYRSHMRNTFLVMGVLSLTMACFIIQIHFGSTSSDQTTSMSVLAIVCLIPIVVLSFPAFYSLYRWRKPIRRAQDYHYYEVQFQNPTPMFDKRRSYFSFEFFDSNGKTIRASTHAIFSFLWKDMPGSEVKYTNVRVAIAYNPKNDDVVVLRTLEPDDTAEPSDNV